MLDVFIDKFNTDGNCAGIFEANDAVSYFYLYHIAEGTDGHIVGAVQVYRGPADFKQSDVEVRWFDGETKVGVFIKGELGAYFDVIKGWGYSGTYSRHQADS